jgi:hypothetical protein
MNGAITTENVANASANMNRSTIGRYGESILCGAPLSVRRSLSVRDEKASRC